MRYTDQKGVERKKFCVDHPQCEAKNCTDCSWQCESCHIIGGKKKCPGDWTWRLQGPADGRECCKGTPGPMPGSADTICAVDSPKDESSSVGLGILG